MIFLNFFKKEKRIVVVIFVLLSLVTVFKITSGFVINMSESIAPGIYLLYPKTNVKKGDIINFKIPKNIEKISIQRNYITKDIKTLTKYIVAEKGDFIERRNSKIYINNIYKATIYEADSKNRELLSVFLEGEKIILKDGEYFVLGITENSLDSRYYGILKREDIIKKATLILIFEK